MKIKLAAVAATLSLTAIIGSASVAGAWGGHGWNGPGGCAYGPGPGSYSPEQQAAWQDYDQKAAPLASQLRAKQAEMDAVYAQGNPDGAKIQALTKEIGELQGRLYKIDSEYRYKMNPNGGSGWGHRGGRGGGGHHGGHRW